MKNTEISFHISTGYELNLSSVQFKDCSLEDYRVKALVMRHSRWALLSLKGTTK